METRARTLAAAALLAVVGLALMGMAGRIAQWLKGSDGLSGPSAADIEDVISGAIRITREAAG
jgi:hypothetical protein